MKKVMITCGSLVPIMTALWLGATAVVIFKISESEGATEVGCGLLFAAMDMAELADTMLNG